MAEKQTIEQEEHVDIEEEVLTEGDESVEEELENEGSEKEESSEDVVLTIEDQEIVDEHEDASTPQWVKDLRKKNREDGKRIKELTKELEALKTPEQKNGALGDEPTLESCDWDEDKFKSEWRQWNSRKSEIEAEEKARQEEVERQNQQWQQTLDSYHEKRSALPFSDVDEVEDAAKDALDETQQGVILHVASNPAVVLYAIGKNQSKLEEIANIKDPLKLAAYISKFEDKINMKPRKSPPAPEKTVTGTAPKTASADSHLEKLRAKAEKTGDFSEVHAYKRKLRAAK